MAYPGTSHQVEVYDPKRGAAAALLKSGELTALGKSAAKPTAASVGELKSLARSLGHPIYWVGPRESTTYELIRGSGGKIIIRYLPQGVKVGTQKPYLSVATYPFPGAFRAIEALAKEDSQASIRPPDGGLGGVRQVLSEEHPSRLSRGRSTRSRSSTRPRPGFKTSSPRARSAPSAEPSPAAPPREMRAEPASSLPAGRREPPGRLVWRLDTPAGLVAMFAVAFLVPGPDRASYGLLRRPSAVPDVGGAAGRRGDAALLRPGPVRRLSPGIPVRPVADRQDLRDAGVPAAEAARDPCRPRNRLDCRNVRRADRSRVGKGTVSGPRAGRRRRALQPRGDRAQRGLGAGGRGAGPVRAVGRCCCSSRERIRCGATSPPSSCSRSPSR